jgi:hypothetical protein
MGHLKFVTRKAMEISQNDVEALFNKQRIDEAVSDDAPLANPLKPLRTFREFIDSTRIKLGNSYNRIKDKESQLINMHRQTVIKIQQTKRIPKESIDFFEERKRDYEAMINLVLKGAKEGRIIKVPSFGSTILK